METCFQPGLHYIPLSIFILMPTTFLTTYLIAVFKNHVEPDFPYISDTGAESPESCIFSQFVNIAAVLIGAAVYIRYKQVIAHVEGMKLNTAALIIGLISAFGISIVANFQESKIKEVHLFGAVLAFGLGNVYCWMQGVLSLRLCPHVNTHRLAIIRLLLSAAVTFSFISTYACDALSKQYFHGKNFRKWSMKDGGFVLHIVSAGCEWLMSLAQLCFFLTFVREFRGYSMSAPQVHPCLVSSLGKRVSPFAAESSDLDPDSLIAATC